MKNSDIKLVKKELNESPFEFLYKIFRDIEKETKSKVGNRYFTWSEHFNNWININQSLLKIIPSVNSLTIVRFTEFNRIMPWIQVCVYCGQYYSALRELRFLLEFMIKAYYLDKLYPENSVRFKLEKDKEKRLYGSKLIKELDFSQDIKNNLNELYNELSAYTHPTKEELAQLMAGKIELYITFAFNDFMFNKCVGLTNRVVDSVFFIALNKFPEVIQNIKNNSLLLKSLKEFGCKLTLNYIEMS